MPTYARKHQLKLSLIYHLYSRSNGKMPIFKSEKVGQEKELLLNL